MVTPEFQPFFLASVGASSALIGLLFVSVSIAPERVFGEQSEVGLGRAWELLGAPRSGIISGAVESLVGRLDRRTPSRKP
jgi:hypothetical protein